MSEPATEPRGNVLRVLDHIRTHGPIVPGRYSPTSQCAQAAGVTINRCHQILQRLESQGRIRAERVPAKLRGPGRVIRLEATQ